MSRRWAALLAASVGAAGCANNMDVVATSRSDSSTDGGIRLSGTPIPCELGSYSGHIFTTPGDGGPLFTYTGDIGFSLTQTRSGEISVLSDKAVLSGMGTDGSMFRAEIVQGKCQDGMVSSQLKNGIFTTSGMPPAMINFDGEITGEYVVKYHGFLGDWMTSLHLPAGDYVISGRWTASLMP